MYINYNDYELIYLINENVDKAFNFLFFKYEHLMHSITKALYPYGDKREDLVQEGRILLNKCINKYSFEYDISFYSFFLLCFKRMVERKIGNDYYKPYLVFKEEYVKEDLHYKYLYTYKKTFENDKLAMLIYDECILGTSTLLELSLNYDISYNKLIKKKNMIASYLKKHID